MKAGNHTYALLGALALGMAMTGCPNDDREGDGVLKPLDTFVADTTPPPDTSIVRLDNGEPCAQDSDCASNLCANASGEGRICTEACGDGNTCPSGLVCVSDGEQSLCVKADVVNCQPCTEDASCNVSGLTGNKCVAYGDDGSFCGQGCTGDGDCPDGYTCADGGCKKSDGMCECNAAGIALEASTTCAITNTHGSCEGTRGCGSGGLSRCYAETPAAEICNGRDDNCSGEADEGTSGAECELTNEFGTCIGVVQCTDGQPLCVGRAPAAEICNGVDDNCNDQIDEGSPDVDEDDIADCVDDDWDNDGSKNPDDCQPYNQDVHPGAVDVCNGVDDDCSRLIDDGAAAGCGCYACGGIQGCLTACDTNADVVAGYVCDTGDFDDDENTHECLPSVCGNSIVEAGELCDDGENVGAYDGCFGCIQLGPYCGDGRRDHAFEQCDDGEANGQPNKCNLTCSGPTPPDCGNGVQETGEACDLGEANSNTADALCRTDCTPKRCGDNVVDTGEACDAGNANGGSICGCQDSCTFASADKVCRESSGGACDVTEFCTGQGACPANTHLNGTVCRPVDGACDVAELCDGTSAQCPTDTVAGTNVECRPSAGICDVAENCGGVSKLCPANDIKRPPTYVCRPSEGGCDPAETCTGESALCPNDVISEAGTVCNESTGECDIAEECDGESAACPTNAFADAETVCHESMGECDPTVYCSGDSAECDYDGFFGVGVVCREAGGDCDSAEDCDGLSPDCPETGYDDNTTVCRPAAGPCDKEELCPGDSAECPEVDSFFGNDTPCREAVDEACDYTEYCEGNSTQCPEDVVVGADVNCHTAEGECDTNGTCDGFGACSWTGYAEAGTVCRPAAEGGCDFEETCNGDDPWCPEDVVEEAGTVCREGGDDCNPSEKCDGVSGVCPSDYQWPDGADCTDTPSCTESPCACDVVAGDPAESTCVPSCGNGTIEGEEYCDDAGLNGQRNFCNTMCSAPCGVENEWVRQGGGASWDRSNAVAVDGDGVAYDAGSYFSPSILSAPGLGQYEFGGRLFSNEGWEDVFVQATDANNVPVWAVCATGMGTDVAYGVAVDESDVWVVGTFDEQLTFNCCDSLTPGDTECPVLMGLNEVEQRDAFVARFDRTTGELLWAEHAGTTLGDDEARDVAATPSGDAVVVGYVQGSATAMFGTTDLTLSGSGDAFVASWNGNGGLNWAHLVGGADWDEATDVVLDGEGNAYVVGTFTNSASIDEIDLASEFQGAQALWVARFGTDGVADWAVAVDDEHASEGASEPIDVAYGCVGATPTCSLYVLIADWEFGRNTLLVIDPSTGLVTEPREIDLGSPWFIEAMTTDRSGDLTFTGGFCDTLDLGDGIPGLTGPDCNDETVDGFVARMRADDGAWAWARRFGATEGEDWGRDVASGPAGSVYVSGGFSGSDPTCTVDYEERFSSGAGNWQLAGDAVVVDDGVEQYARLTTAWFGQNGKIVNYIDVVEEGATRIGFDFFVSAPDFNFGGADGLALSIVKATPAELAALLLETESGGGLGYDVPDNTLPAMTIEVDTYMNEEEGYGIDEIGHVAVTTGLSALDPTKQLARHVISDLSLESGTWHNLQVQIFGNDLTVWLDGDEVIALTVDFDFVGGRMFVSGATGSEISEHRVDNLRIENCEYDFGGAIETWGNTDAFVAKFIPSTDGCDECGDGVPQEGEFCDDGDVSTCGGTCNDTCTGPANTCGDGWAECGEDYDLSNGTPDAMMCTLPEAGNAWCFEIADTDPTTNNNFTRDPVSPGEPADIGDGVLPENWNDVDAENGLGGNPVQLDVCPATRSDGTEVNHQAFSGRQWRGDVINPGAVSEGDVTYCNGAGGTSISPYSFATGGNTLAAAIQCGDYYEFVSSTGETVAFQFDDRAGNQGPTNWALYVSLSGADGTWKSAGRGTTFQAGDFGAGLSTPMTSFDLTDFVTAEGPVANQPEVHFRLYGWGSNAPSDPWTLDNVRVGPPMVTQPFYELFCFEETEVSAFSSSPTLDRGQLATFVRGTGVALSSGSFSTTGNNTDKPAACPVFSSGSNQAAIGTGFNVADFAAAVTNGKYYEFNFDSPAGEVQIEFEVRRSGSGPLSLAVTSSELASPIAVDVATPVTDAWGRYTYTFTSTGSGTNRVRVYGYNTTNAGGTFRIDNVSLKAIASIP
ncbi:MAG: hypothetical protein IT385_13295 [Deltaproteobacteria bacterium]|nr:hypothetical protein [Deltaproteobacteria bacterium]